MTLINTSRTNQHLPYIVDTTWANHNPLDWQRSSRSYVNTHRCQKTSRQYLSWRHRLHKRQLIAPTCNSNSRNRARHSLLRSWLHTLTTKCVINTINSVFGSWQSLNRSWICRLLGNMKFHYCGQDSQLPIYQLFTCAGAIQPLNLTPCLYKIDFTFVISPRSSFKVSWSMFYVLCTLSSLIHAQAFCFFFIFNNLQCVRFD